MLELDGVSVRYDQKCILHDITFNVDIGTFTVLIGPNGAGKSSLLRAIAGITPLHTGHIRWQQKIVHAMTPGERASHVAVVPQAVVMPAGFTVREVVRMARYAFTPWFRALSPKDDSIVDYALVQSGMSAFADVPADKLSGGEQQRVAFARALAQQTQILLLDETTAHLDLHHQQAILRCARELTRCGVTVIAAMHDINLAASMADYVVLLQHGRIAHMGEPRVVLTHQILESIYDTTLQQVPRKDSPIPFFMVQP